MDQVTSIAPRAHFRGDFAAAPLKRYFVRIDDAVQWADFRGDFAAAPLKLAASRIASDPTRDFRGDFAAAPLKQGDVSRAAFYKLISAAISPRPH